MASKARAGLGVKMTFGDTPVAELSSVGGIAITTETIDVSNHDTEGGYREFITSLKDGGEFTVEGNFVGGDEGQMAIYNAAQNNTLEDVEITFPTSGTETTGAKWQCTCLVTSCTPVGDATIDSQLTFSATLKISGKPIFTAPVTGA